MGSVAFHCDGVWVATSSIDKTASLWDITSGERLQVYKAHTGPIHCLRFSPGGDTIATSSQDSRTILWETETGKQISVLTGHALSMKVGSVGFSPAGTLLATGSEDGTVRLWNLVKGECRAKFKLT